MSYLHILQHGCIILVILSIDLFKIYDPLVSVQGQFNPKFMTLSSQYKVIQSKIYDPLVSVQGQNEEQWPSHLSTRPVQSKIYNPLVSVQGQNEEQWPSRLSTRSVQFKIYDPLVSAQGQFKVRDPLVLVPVSYTHLTLPTKRIV